MGIPFKQNDTFDQTLHAPSGDVMVPFLHARRDAEILDAPECAALRLPYRGGTLEMLLLLPSPSNSLADVEVRLGRPFLFLIRETRYGLILFLGRVCRPSAFSVVQPSASGRDGERENFISE